MQYFRHLNALGLLAINAILLFAFYDQYVYHDLPCPLCLLQRVGFVALMFGFLLNIQNGPKSSHYGLILIASFYGAAVALRQISLHVIPGTRGCGDPFVGLHYYTWAFISFSVILLGISILLMVPGQYKHEPSVICFKQQPVWIQGIIVITFVIIAANAGSAFFECGVGACSDNPDMYKLME